MDMAFIRWLEQKKDEAGSGEALSRQLGLDGSYISRILRGERRPTVTLYRRVVQAYPEEKAEIMAMLLGDDAGCAP